ITVANLLGFNKSPKQARCNPWMLFINPLLDHHRMENRKDFRPLKVVEFHVLIVGEKPRNARMPHSELGRNPGKNQGINLTVRQSIGQRLPMRKDRYIKL